MEEADRVPPAPGRRRGGARGRRQPSGRWRAQPAGARPRGSVPPLPPAPTSAPQTLGRQPAAFARVWRARADTPGSATGGCQRTTAISAATAAPLPGRDQREGQMKRGEPTAAAAATPPRATCWEPPLPAKKGYKKRGDRARRVAVRAPRPSCSTCTYTTLCTGGEKRDTRWDAYATKDKNTQGETTIDKTKTTHERASLKGWVERRKTPGQANTSSWSASTASTPPSSPSTAAKLRKCVGRWASS